MAIDPIIGNADRLLVGCLGLLAMLSASGAIVWFGTRVARVFRRN